MLVSTPIHRNVSFPNHDLLAEVINTTMSLVEKINDTTLETYNISEYTQKYIRDSYKKKTGWSRNCVSLASLLDKCKLSRDQICLLDYGAGLGSICLLAKTLGIGTVIYSDIYDQSCKDAARLGETLNLKADQYICGEINDVILYMRENDINCDLLVSNNCIEHIYDIEVFLRGIVDLPKRNMHFRLSTGANPFYPKSRKILMKKAIDAEYKNREKKLGHKERDTLKSFLSIRIKMIKKFGNKLNDEEIQTLAKKTRGLRYDDIGKVVKKYLSTGIMPSNPDHPTNTCDPYTGNWAERLMNPYELAQILQQQGGIVEVKPAYWPRHTENKWKDHARAIMNLAISASSKLGLRISSGYVLSGHF